MKLLNPQKSPYPAIAAKCIGQANIGNAFYTHPIHMWHAIVCESGGLMLHRRRSRARIRVGQAGRWWTGEQNAATPQPGTDAHNLCPSLMSLNNMIPKTIFEVFIDNTQRILILVIGDSFQLKQSLNSISRRSTLSSSFPHSEISLNV